MAVNQFALLRLRVQLLLLLLLLTTSVTLGQRIRSIALINTQTKQILGAVKNDTIINLSEVGDRITLRAFAAPTNSSNGKIRSVRSVVFDLNGKKRVQIENYVPYTLAGDQGNVFHHSEEITKLGNHVVSVTPYTRRNGTGSAGQTYTVRFTTVAETLFNIPTSKPTSKPSSKPTAAPALKPTSTPTSKPTSTPVAAPMQPSIITRCGCASCTEQIWNQLADGISCGERITWVKNNLGKSDAEACIRVSLEYPTICGVGCKTDTCDGKGPKYCGCNSCTDNIWNQLADGISCGKRISWVVTNLGKSEKDACIQLSNEFPTVCGVGCNSGTCNNLFSPAQSPALPPSNNGPNYCGCDTCTESIWNQLADGISCGERITWVKNNLGKSEKDACIQLSTEFPTICGVGCNSGTCGAPVPVQPPAPITIPQSSPVIVAPVPVTPTSPVASSSNKCGGAVNTGGTSTATCTKDLWNPTGDTTQHCYAYGGPSDPCALHNNNDVNDGLLKSPASCLGDTFYLWDEPDTQGKNYTWAGIEWAKYATRYSTEIQTLRSKGVQFTSPLLKAGEPGAIASYLDSFYTACGAACHDPQSPAYININAINAFAGPWNDPGIDGCRDGAIYITNELMSYNSNNNIGRRPWYVTNWSRLGTDRIADQVDAMNVIEHFFMNGSPVQRIYWFGAIDYGGNSSNNFLTTSFVNTNGVTTTLGQVWKTKCDTL